MSLLGVWVCGVHCGAFASVQVHCGAAVQRHGKVQRKEILPGHVVGAGPDRVLYYSTHRRLHEVRYELVLPEQRVGCGVPPNFWYSDNGARWQHGQEAEEEEKKSGTWALPARPTSERRDHHVREL